MIVSLFDKLVERSRRTTADPKTDAQ